MLSVFLRNMVYLRPPALEHARLFFRDLLPEIMEDPIADSIGGPRPELFAGSEFRVERRR